MPAIDFPNSPSVNDTHTVGNRVWKWNGTVWEVVRGQTTPATTSSSVSSNITLAANNKYFVTTSAARTLTLPASASIGDFIEIYDATGTAATYNITVASNSLKINGSVQNYIIDINGAAVVLTYTGSSYGWKVK
jgi:hypothetical protein